MKNKVLIKCGDKTIAEIDNDKSSYQLRKLLLKMGIYSNYEGYKYILKAIKNITKAGNTH